MLEQQQAFDILYNSTFCICAQTPKLYLLFFKKLIEKYLSDVLNYNIIVSTTNKLLPLYQSIWPTHSRLMYIADNLVPTGISHNIRTIYIYHQITKPNDEQQMNLIIWILIPM